MPPPGSVTEETDGHDASSARRNRPPGVADLSLVFLIMGGAVYVLVLVLLVVPMLRRRLARRTRGRPRTAARCPIAPEVPGRMATAWIVGPGVLMPLGVDRGAGAQRVDDASHPSGRTTGERRDRRRRVPVLVVGAVPGRGDRGGRRDTRAVGEQISLRLRSVDVIHSFWVPELHGKLDACLAIRTSWCLRPTRPATMAASAPSFAGFSTPMWACWWWPSRAEDFDRWLAAQRAAGSGGGGRGGAYRGQRLFPAKGAWIVTPCAASSSATERRRT